MRLRRVLTVALGSAVVASSLLGRTPLSAASSNGDFIVKCRSAGNVAAVDPIVAPGTAETAHYHVFYGNRTDPSAALTNTAVETNLSTTCRDPQDTSLMWTPAFWRCAWNGPNAAPVSCTAFTTDPGGAAINLRVYYIAHSAGGSINYLPDSTVFVQGNTTAQNADGTSNTGFPASLLRARGGVTISDFDCGAGTSAPTTPHSPWPYNCSLVAPYCGQSQTASASYCGFGAMPSACALSTCTATTYGGQTWWYENGYCTPTEFDCDSDSNPNVHLDGMVEEITMPDCWNGGADAQITGGTVPGFIPSRFGPGGGAVSDFAYQTSPGMCPPGYPYHVPEVSLRTHWSMSDPLAGASSASATVDGGTSIEGRPACSHLKADDAAPCTTTPPRPTDLSIWIGPMTGAGAAGCPDSAAPPNPLPDGPGGSACLMGLNAAHADYWNTWQQPESCDEVRPSVAGNIDACGVEEPPSQPATRTLDDLTEDCLHAGPDPRDQVTCGFVTATSSNVEGR